MVCKEASLQDLELRWDKDIAENAGDDRWSAWKKRSILENRNGLIKTFCALDKEDIVGVGTLALDPASGQLNGNGSLANKDTANVCALRVDEKYQGKGIASGLVRFAEAWALGHGIKNLTIGVEPKDVKNMQIYFHLGFTEFIMWNKEKYSPEDEPVLVLYYRKRL
ncbi:MAG: GNAT family N-acetyltransferase [Rickettsiales bacterium]|jgi:GNAT superfamily N-acetyltransferase|nr:GNAT family N-acetyltransferase [Rickettsiales bacterium]